MSNSPIIFWFRRDLRLEDNPALFDAAQRSNGVVAPVFIIDEIFAAPAGPTRTAYLRSTLQSLDDSLEARLNILVGEPHVQLVAFAKNIGASEVVATEDFGPKGRIRDAAVRSALSREGIDFTLIDSPYVVKPGTITTKNGSPCRVFGAFRKSWATYEVREPVEVVSNIDWVRASSLAIEELTVHSSTRRPHYFGDLPDGPAPSMPKAGETAAKEALLEFVKIADQYGESRDVPGLAGTSRLSAFLRFGAIHPRQILNVLGAHSSGREVYRTELCWREFYADVLLHRPESVSQVLQPSLEHLRVDTDERAVERFQTWARGETGFPLVDAGMRQLLEEGWMHNRVRMVCASFLVKHLHIDWRWGAKWFMWRLCDGDVASNQHGWQWTAGTGTDAAPFHRVFNPTLQAQRFDPNGDYVHRYVPELLSVPAPACLSPGGGEGLLAPSGYPLAMLDAATERNEALARFAEARAMSKVRS